MHSTLECLKHGIIVSAQASEGEPLNTPEILCAMAESALNGGAVGIRMAQPENISIFKKKHPNVPVIGITKPHVIPENAVELVYITPNFSDVSVLAGCCDIVALDATVRPRPNGETLADIVQKTREQYPHLLLMADISTLAEGLNALHLGFDLISTTLAGYTSETGHLKLQGPDFGLLALLIEQTQTPIVLEGRVWEPSDVKKAFQLGAFSVVIGSAVTRPHEITKRFVQAAC